MARPGLDWYREELRDYVKVNHRRPRLRPPVPVTSYDAQSDCYSWDWGGLHLVQAHRHPGDTTKGARSTACHGSSDLATGQAMVGR